MKRNRLSLFVLAFAVPVLLLWWGLTTAVFPPTVHAAPLETVTTLLDENDGCGVGAGCSLREAIADVDPGGTIEFGVSGTIVLASELAINKEVTIDGGNTITVSGNNSVRAFNIGSSGIVTLTRLTIRDGSANIGGAINSSGRLTVTHSTLISNTATQAGGAIAGLNAGATLYIADSTLQNNVAQSSNGGGAIYNQNTSSVEIRNSILSSNISQGAAGAAITILGTTLNLTQFTMTGSVITNNTMMGGVIPSTVYSQEATAEVTGNCFMGNSDSALRRQGDGSMDATGNWWGSASGPSGAGPGIGDSITGENLVFTPFLTSPILGCGSIDADVVITKSVTPTIVTPDGAITYTLAFTNSGPSVATAVTLADSIPVSVTITGVTSSTVGSGVAITQTSGSPNFAWEVSDLPVGAGGVITLTGIVTVSMPSALSGQIITNTAVVAASNDITTTNNSASAAPHRLCGPGYWLETVTNSCQLTLPGRYVPDFGYTEFFLCPLGTYQPNSGASSCLPAPVNTYVDSQGATAPTACPAGTYNPFQGSASSSACLSPLTVTTLLDESGNCGDGAGCSLREAIAEAANGQTIDFAVSGTIVLGSELVIDKSMTISGTMPITVSGNNSVRIFNISSGTVNIDTLTLQNGLATDGINNNDTGADRAGAIRISTGAVVTVRNSTFTGNEAATLGGAIYQVGSSSSLTVENSTFSDNRAGEYGGGIAQQGSTSIITNSTFSNNRAGLNGGAIYAQASLPSIFTLTNNILANSTTDGITPVSDCMNLGGATINFSSGLSNLIEMDAAGVNACGTAGVDYIQADPNLGALADNGGPTLTHFLLPGSPAIDAGDCTSGPATDQRGVARPQDDTCDIGAYEGGTLQCGIGTSSYSFPNQSNVTILVNSETDLECLYVDEIPVSHPNATGASEGQNLRTGKYWLIGGLQVDGTPATFNVDLTLPYDTASASTRACKWLDGAGAGFGWDCGPTDGTGTDFDPTASVTRLGVTAFSQWAVGDAVGPTAVTNLQASTTSSMGSWWLVGLLVGLMGVATAVFLRRHSAI